VSKDAERPYAVMPSRFNVVVRPARFTKVSRMIDTETSVNILPNKAIECTRGSFFAQRRMQEDADLSEAVEEMDGDEPINAAPGERAQNEATRGKGHNCTSCVSCVHSHETGRITRRFRFAVSSERENKQLRGTLRVRGSASGQAKEPIRSTYGWEIGGLPQRSKTPTQSTFGWAMGLDGDRWAAIMAGSHNDAAACGARGCAGRGVP